MRSSPVIPVLSVQGHPTLPFALLHREPLYLFALRNLVQATGGDLRVVVREPDRSSVIEDVRRERISARVTSGADWVAPEDPRGARYLIHDALCPLVSVDFLRRMAALDEEGSAAAFRPVTDTVKTVVDGAIQGTIDREGLAAITSPLLIPGSALAGGETPDLSDFGALVGQLRKKGTVTLVTGPALSRRVDDDSAVKLLESVDELSRQIVSGGAAARTR